MTDETARPDTAPPMVTGERLDFLPLLAALVPVGLVTALGLAAVWWHGANS